MVSHNIKLFLWIAVALLATSARGEILERCDLIQKAQTEGAINPTLVLAISEIESSRNTKAIGKQDPRDIHYGLMQLKLGTARMLGFRGRPKSLFQAQTNLALGIKYLNQKLNQYHSIEAAAAAYNAGAAYPCKKVHKECKGKRFVNQDYVDAVVAEYKKYEKKKGCVEPLHRATI